MKNKFLKYIYVLILMLIQQNVNSEELNINASTIELDKVSKVVYAKGKVEISDKQKNIFFSENAEYDKLNGIVKTIGPTKILTSEKYEVQGDNLCYDNNKIFSAILFI